MWRRKWYLPGRNHSQNGVTSGGEVGTPVVPYTSRFSLSLGGRGFPTILLVVWSSGSTHTGPNTVSVLGHVRALGSGTSPRERGG